MRPLLTTSVCLLPVLLQAAPPKPSMWQLADQSASSRPFNEVPACTRSTLDANYGANWHAAPRSYAFLDYFGGTADIGLSRTGTRGESTCTA